MKTSTIATLVASAAFANAQNATKSTAPSAIANATRTQNPTRLASAFILNVNDLWDMLVGPVTEAYYTTTISATPVPSSSLIPPPPLYYPSFPTGPQSPTQAKNESWSFPKDFWYVRIHNLLIYLLISSRWGVAGAAYQVEGAAKDGGRGPSVWDVLSHRATDFVVNNHTADVTNNNYYMYKDDIARIAALGVKAYSLSLSWSRILPFGRGPVNEEAIAHYNDVINTCIEYNVIPMVTLYHWDTPLMLQDTYGGWLSEDIVNDFVEYARIAYGRFGDRVQHWFTVNERTSQLEPIYWRSTDRRSDRLLPAIPISGALLQDLPHPGCASTVSLWAERAPGTFPSISSRKEDDA